jgi:3D (Asp-Asp-Asp) domain-containing protein
MKHAPALLLGLAFGVTACTTSGSTWMAQPLTANDEDGSDLVPGTSPRPARELKPRAGHEDFATQTLTGDQSKSGAKTLSDEPLRVVRRIDGKLQGKVLGKFRNTYYDFPSESDFKGKAVALKSAECQTIKDVPRGFFEAVCVQGSGTLSGGQTVSFAKRDCGCAEVCPRTGQKICFDALDARQFPYGRGATGNPITPLSSVAVDTSVIPLGTMIYIPELDGMPRDRESSALHDGCFIAQDRGLRVKGKHVDVFTGDTTTTRLWNKLVPSNEGVTVVLDSPRCARAAAVETESPASTADSAPSPKKDRERDKEHKRSRSSKKQDPDN